MTRWKAWDGKPSMQTMFWGLVNDVAFFDDNMNMIGSQQSSKFPADISYAGGKFYIQYTDGSIISSTDGARWSNVSSGVMPLGGAETKFAAASKDGVIYAGLDGDDMLPVELQTVSVPYVEYLRGGGRIYRKLRQLHLRIVRRSVLDYSAGPRRRMRSSR